MSISLEEFKAWLSGVEDMQEEGWTPSKVQWTKIREKIDSIEVKPSVFPVVPQPQQYTYPGMQQWITADASHNNVQQPVVPQQPIVPQQSVLPQINIKKTPKGPPSDENFDSAFL